MRIRDVSEIELKKIRLEGDPDLVFLSSEPFPFKEGDAFEIGSHTHHAKTVFVDGEMFSWHGSRLLKRLTTLKKCIKNYNSFFKSIFHKHCTLAVFLRY
jgi:hypothetical protein